MNRTCDTRIRNQYPPTQAPTKPPESLPKDLKRQGEICEREHDFNRPQALFTHEFPHTSDTNEIPRTGHCFIPQGGVGGRDLPRKRSPRQRPGPSNQTSEIQKNIFYVPSVIKLLDKTYPEVLLSKLYNTMYSNSDRRCQVATETKKVSFDCNVEVLERLDRLAKKGDIPRSKLIANIIEVGVESLEGSEKIGLLQVSLLMRNMAEHLKVWSKKMKNKKDLEGLM